MSRRQHYNLSEPSPYDLWRQGWRGAMERSVWVVSDPPWSLLLLNLTGKWKLLGLWTAIIVRGGKVRERWLHWIKTRRERELLATAPQAFWMRRKNYGPKGIFPAVPPNLSVDINTTYFYINIKITCAFSVHSQTSANCNILFFCDVHSRETDYH